jgi:hypothetical protein
MRQRTGVGGLLHRHAGDVGGARGVGAHVERRQVGVGGVQDDVLDGTPSTSAAIWARTVSAPVPRSVAPTKHVERAVVVHLDGAGAHVEERDGGAVHAEREADAPTDVGAVGRAPPVSSSRRCQPMARLPWATHSSMPLDVTRGSSSAISSGHAALAEAGSDVELVAHRTQWRRLNSMGSSPRACGRGPPCGTRARRGPGARRSRGRRPATGMLVYATSQSNRLFGQLYDDRPRSPLTVCTVNPWVP